MDELKKYFISFLVFLLICIGTGCSKESTNEPVDTDYTVTVIGEVSDQFLEYVDHFMENDLDRIKYDLNLTEIPIIRLKVYENETAFFDYMEECIGEKHYGSYIFTSSYDEITMYKMDGIQGVIPYELGHLLQVYINPTIKDNPRWLYEGVAVYESNTFVDPSILPYMVSRDFPDFEQLNDTETLERNKINQTGYVLIEFIREVYGADNLIQLIETNGDIQNVLNITETQFLDAWYNWIITYYLN